MTQRISFRKEYYYDYQPTPSPTPRDAVAATCRWCGQTWQSEHRIQYSPCCYVPRVKYGEVSLMRRPRHPFRQPAKRDRLLRGGKIREVRMVDAGGVMFTDGAYVTWAQWEILIRGAKVVQRGDA